LDAADGGLVNHQTWTFNDVSSLDAFLNDNTVDVGFVTDPAMTFSLGFDLIASGDGGLDYGFAFVTVSPAELPEPGSLIILLTACALGGLLARSGRTGTLARRGGACRIHDV
jgi:hypothetical protein